MDRGEHADNDVAAAPADADGPAAGSGEDAVENQDPADRGGVDDGAGPIPAPETALPPQASGEVAMDLLARRWDLADGALAEVR